MKRWMKLSYHIAINEFNMSYVPTIKIRERRGKIREKKRKNKHCINKNVKQLEEVLGDKPYFGGETFGFVDIALIPFYKWFSSYEKVGNFKLHYPKLIGWANRCLERESVSKSVSDEKDVYEFVLMYRKLIGVDWDTKTPTNNDEMLWDWQVCVHQINDVIKCCKLVGLD